MTKYQSNCFIVVLSALVTCSGVQDEAAATPPAYRITDLGTLGGTDSLGWGINASGHVTGYAATTDDENVDAFLWTPTTPNSPSGEMHDLGTLGGSFAWGIGINAGGQIAGVSATEEDEAEHATLWNPTTPGATSGMLHDLETLGGAYSQGTGINVSGQVTGYSDTTEDAAEHAFLWIPTVPNGTSGTMHDLETLGGTYSFGWDINATGQVTGDSDTTDDAATHAFLWIPTVPNGTSGTMHDLETLGGTASEGSGVNDSGQVAGSSLTTDDEATHAFLWTPTTPGAESGMMKDLGTLGGLNSYGYNVSAAGHVVGLSEVEAEVSNSSHAFLYTTDSGMVNLNTLIDPLSGWELLDASDINEFGQITGQGLIDDEYHAYLLTPIPALLGDYDANGTVGPEDYDLWKASFGSTTVLAADGNGNNIVDAADYTIWRDHLSDPPGNASALLDNRTIPEPGSMLLLLVGTMILFRRALG